MIGNEGPIDERVVFVGECSFILFENCPALSVDFCLLTLLPFLVFQLLCCFGLLPKPVFSLPTHVCIEGYDFLHASAVSLLLGGSLRLWVFLILSVVNDETFRFLLIYPSIRPSSETMNENRDLIAHDDLLLFGGFGSLWG